MPTPDGVTSMPMPERAECEATALAMLDCDMAIYSQEAVRILVMRLKQRGWTFCSKADVAPFCTAVPE